MNGPDPTGLRKRVARTSAVPHEDRLAILRDVVPEAFPDHNLDTRAFAETVGSVTPEKERYGLGWTGKTSAVGLLGVPSLGALTPKRDESMDFDVTGNVIIDGENLEVLKLLYKAYFGRVKVIYLDPPYNTGKDFVYSDSYAEPTEQYLRASGQKDNVGNLLTSNPDTSGRYHSAWLSMMYPRLWIARQLLREDGVIFVSIDDNEIHNLRLVMNEVFGEENFVAQITIETNPKGRGLREHFARNHDYLLVYTRAELEADLSLELTEDEVKARYREKDEHGRFRYLELRNTHRQFGKFNRPNLYYPLYVNTETNAVSLEASDGSVECLPDWDDGFQGCWGWGKGKVSKEGHLLVGRKVRGQWKVFRKAYYATEDGEDTARRKLKTIWMERQYHTEVGQEVLDALIPGRVFQSPKPPALIKTALQLTNDPDGLVLDFFVGSGTTAQAVLELNREDGGSRRFVLVQLPEPTPEDSNARKEGFETIGDICKERVRRVIAKLQGESHSKLDLADRELPEDLGFRVFRLTASSFARWTEIATEDETEYTKQMELLADGLAEGWTVEDVLWEVALKEGFGLSSRVHTVDMATDLTVYRVDDFDLEQSIMVCLEDKVSLEALRPLGLTQDTVFVCRDSALDDSVAANLALQTRLRTI
jgi:adenine-specific DNA-methyltransferase